MAEAAIASGASLLSRGDVDGALACVAAALELDAGCALAHRLRTQALQKRKPSDVCAVAEAVLEAVARCGIKEGVDPNLCSG